MSWILAFLVKTWTSVVKGNLSKGNRDSTLSNLEYHYANR